MTFHREEKKKKKKIKQKQEDKQTPKENKIQHQRHTMATACFIPGSFSSFPDSCMTVPSELSLSKQQTKKHQKKTLCIR